MLELNRNNGPISKYFVENGIFNFLKACRLVKSLPYQRVSVNNDPLAVVKEGKGTCSTKHAILKRLADENNFQEVKLILCIFKMNKSNTPQIAPLLNKYKLNYIPEAHNYLSIKGKMIDVTFPNSEQTQTTFMDDMLSKEEIEASQIIGYKQAFHKHYIRTYYLSETHFTLEEIWKIREECIEALGN